jgi:stage V sporulation protein AD
MNENTIEKAESKYQEYTINELLKRNMADLLISGDLQNQILSSSLASSKIKIPTLGIYSACATFIEGLIIGSMFVDNSKNNVIVSTSSHNLVSEKQFRFPLELGNQRPPSAQWTVTGSGAALLSKTGNGPFITHITIILLF